MTKRRALCSMDSIVSVTQDRTRCCWTLSSTSALKPWPPLDRSPGPGPCDKLTGGTFSARSATSLFSLHRSRRMQATWMLTDKSDKKSSDCGLIFKIGIKQWQQMPNRAKEVLFSWERLGWSMSIASHTVAMALPLKLMCNYIYIYLFIYISTQYMYYIWSRPAPGHPPLNAIPPAPPSNPSRGWLAIYRPPSRSHMLICYTYILASCHLCTT